MKDDVLDLHYYYVKLDSEVKVEGKAIIKDLYPNTSCSSISLSLCPMLHLKLSLMYHMLHK